MVDPNLQRLVMSPRRHLIQSSKVFVNSSRYQGNQSKQVVAGTVRNAEEDVGKTASGNKDAGKRDTGKKPVGTGDLADDRLAKFKAKEIFGNSMLAKEAAAKETSDTNTSKERVLSADEVEENPGGGGGESAKRV
jgi:hypothetical protein